MPDHMIRSSEKPDFQMLTENRSVMVLMSYLLAACSRHRDQQLTRPCCRLTGGTSRLY